MHWLDWSILGFTVFVTLAMAVISKKYTKSVADFVSANRCGGRYVLGVSEGIAMIGAISVVLMFEMYYRSGFSAVWWSMMQLPIGLVVAVTGWVIYRYRQTRAMTLAQFFELRYSRNFRVFAGILAWAAGIVNYGIFPAVSAKFFIYFCGFPQSFELAGMTISTFPTLMFIFLSIALFTVFMGGQIAVMITDFFQGLFCNVVFIVVIFYLFYRFNWNSMVDVIGATEAGRALFDPMMGGLGDDFGFVFFFIGAMQMFFNNIGWQGRSGFNSAAKSPHEAKMAKVLGTWRQLINVVVMVVIPVFVFALMRSPEHTALASTINNAVAQIPDTQIQTQMFVPTAISKIFPIGIMGLFAAMMFFAMVTTDEPYLHAWGSILVQDVVVPLRGKALSTKHHMLLLRVSIISVAIFAFFFSLIFQQTTYIAMFFQVTGAIFLGGAGSVIIGGLYWKRGTTLAAWSTMLVGSTMAVSGIFVQKYIPSFPLNGMHIAGITMLTSGAVYVLVSLFGPRTDFNLDKMLHRGQYATEYTSKAALKIGWRSLITEEFTRNDKIIYLAVIGWTLGLFVLFVAGTLISKIWVIGFSTWAMFWKIYIITTAAIGGITTVWFAIGGAFEIRDIFKILSANTRNDLDDGRVIGNHNAGEESDDDGPAARQPKTTKEPWEDESEILTPEEA